MQAAVEKAGIPTVSVSMLPEVTAKVGPPRVLVVPYPLGYPMGEPGNREVQTRILLSALDLLQRQDLPVIARS